MLYDSTELKEEMGEGLSMFPFVFCACIWKRIKTNQKTYSAFAF